MPRTAYHRKDAANTKPVSDADAVKMRAIRRAAINGTFSEYAIANEFACSTYMVRMAIEGVGMAMEWCEECERRVVTPCVECNARRWAKATKATKAKESK